MVTRASALTLAAAALAAAGCNAILGIDSHALALADDGGAGDDGAAGTDGNAGPDAGPGPDGGASDAVGIDAVQCSDGGWCSSVTPPAPHHLRAVWSSGPEDTWAIGDSGTILRWKGAVWTGTPGNANEELSGIWGNNATDIWVVGHDANEQKGIIRHWDGATWTNVPSGTAQPLHGVWASGPNDAWAVGDAGTVQHVHFDGVSWSSFPDPSLPILADRLLTSIWGMGPRNLWVVGSSGVMPDGSVSGSTILHWDGTDWTEYSRAPLATATLNQIWGNASGQELWAVGDQGTIVHYDGRTWAPIRGITTQDLNSVWGFTHDEVLAPGATDIVWIVGASGTVLRRGGPSLRDFATLSDPRIQDQTLLGVSGSADNDVWIVGDDDLRLHWTNAFFPIDNAYPLAEGNVLTSVWGSGSNDVWAVGEGGGIIHWNGAAWFAVTSADNSITTSNLGHVWGSGPNDVWAVGTGGTILRWDGTHWWCTSAIDVCTTHETAPFPPSPVSADLYGVWGSGPNDVWLVGQNGTILHSKDGTFTTSQTPTGTGNVILNDVSGSASDDVWAVGENGTILRFDGEKWSLLKSNCATAKLNGVWSLGTDDVLIVGDGDRTVRFNSKMSCMVFPDPTKMGQPPNLMAVWGLGSNNAWIVGTGGVIMSWDGSHLTPSPTGVDSDLLGVWGSSLGDVWTVGDGRIMHH
jgi:hypothetical protein